MQSLGCAGFFALVALVALAASAALAPTSLHAIPPKAANGLIWEAAIAPSAAHDPYGSAVAALLASYEASVGVKLQPAERGKVALKVDSHSGRGLGTPLALIRALVAVLQQRGFTRDSILIVDQTASGLRALGVLPPLSDSGAAYFEGSPVLAWDSKMHQDPDWFYDSPLPSAMHESASRLEGFSSQLNSIQSAVDRNSYLPMPLLFEVDFWINLATGVDAPALGVDGVLANATLWNVSNSQRFLVSPAAAAAAVAELAAIPELAERWVLNFVSLAMYQYIGGPSFNSLYARSEPKLWLSSDPVALDRLLYERFNHYRRLDGFPEISPLPQQLLFAASLGLGVYEKSQIRIEEIDTPAVEHSVLPEINTSDSRNTLK
ncbi:MAG: hypothetical protein ACI81V_001223 [Lentimonas sp.]|jgi:hypothetical protein